MATKKEDKAKAAKAAKEEKAKAAEVAKAAKAKAAEDAKAAKAKAAEDAKAAKLAKATNTRFTPHYFSGTNNHGTDYAAAIAEGGDLTVRIVKENFIDDVHGYGTEGVAVGPVTEDTARLIAEGKAEQFYYEFL